MFFNINGIKYFIIINGKSIHEICDEIFLRMNANFLSFIDKNKILFKVKNQLYSYEGL